MWHCGTCIFCKCKNINWKYYINCECILTNLLFLAAYFYVGTSRTPSNQKAYRVRDETGNAGVLKRYRRKSITITLPEGKNLNNVNWFSVWCDEFAVSCIYSLPNQWSLMNIMYNLNKNVGFSFNIHKPDFNIRREVLLIFITSKH